MPEDSHPRRPLRWIIATVALCAAVLTTGVWIYPNWKGQRDLDRHFARLRKLGFSTDLRTVYNPAIPPDRDILQHPAVVAEMEKPRSKMTGALFSDKMRSLMGKDLYKSFATGNFTTSTDLTRWGKNLSEPEIARKLLEDLNTERQALKNLQPALERPEIKWPVTWHSQNGAQYPSASFASLFHQGYQECFLMQLYGIAGDRQQMLASKEAVLKLLKIQYYQHQMISIISTKLIVNNFTDSLRELVGRGLLEKDDLKSLLSSLDEIESDSRLKTILLRRMADYGNFNQISHYAQKTDISEGWEWDWDTIKMRTRGIVWAYRPVGLNASDMVRANDLIISKLSEASGGPDRSLTADDALEFEKMAEQAPLVLIEINDLEGVGIVETTDCSASQWYATAEVIQNDLEIQTRLSLARFGLALELYRIEHGSYPDHLNILTPEYLPKAHEDPYHPAPFQYEVKPDGTLRVWSTGMDKKAPKDDLIWEVKP